MDGQYYKVWKIVLKSVVLYGEGTWTKREKDRLTDMGTKDFKNLRIRMNEKLKAVYTGSRPGDWGTKTKV